MQFAREIQNIFIGTLVILALIALSSLYWAIAGPDSIVDREDNPRQIEALAQIRRGGLYDRQGELLAETIRDNGVTRRVYLQESTYSVLGYYSLRYGTGGAEAAFDNILSGRTEANTLNDYFVQNILNVPSVGSDVELTIDVDLQNELTRLMGGYTGAGVIMDAQTGDILALASLPTFNPNQLDDEWDELTQNAGNPFFNRALQGQYQPGGVIYTLWMSQALLTQYDTAQIIANATDTIALGENTQVACVFEAPQSDLSLLDGYQFGCPVPIVVFSRTTSERTYRDLVNNFALDKPITLEGFPIPEIISSTSGTQAEINRDLELITLRHALGQGTDTITPLHVTSILSAIVHNGNAPRPNIQSAIREPDSDVWQSLQQTRSTIPMMTTATVQQLQTVMRGTWRNIQSQTYPEDMSVGATIATSQSGDNIQLWLIGFIRSEQTGRIAFTVLLENTRDTQHMIQIGQTLINTIIENVSID